jgi:hypothetical protein
MHKLTIIIVLTFLICFKGISAQSNKLTKCSLTKILDQKEKQYESLCIEMSKAQWNYYSDGKTDQLPVAKKRLNKFLNDKDFTSLILESYSLRKTLDNKILARRLELWRNVLIGAKVNFSEEIVELQTVLENHLVNTEEQKSVSPASLKELTLELIKLRNKKAKEAGYNNYVEMMLEITGLGKESFDKLVNSLEQLSNEKYLELVKQYKVKSNVKVFTFGDARKMFVKYYQASLIPKIPTEIRDSLIIETFSNIGLDFSSLPISIKQRNMEGAIQGQGIAVKIPKDFRIVTDNDVSFCDLLHEYGHAIHRTNFKGSSPLLKGYEWCTGNVNNSFAEGIGDLFSNITKSAAWLLKYSNLTKEEVDQNNSLIDEYKAVYIRFQIITFLLEYELYYNPDKDILDIQNELVKKYLLVEEPVKRTMNIATPLIVSYPIYAHNYLIADIVSNYIHNELLRKYGIRYTFNKDMVHYIIETYIAEGEYQSTEKLKIIIDDLEEYITKN